MLTTTKKITIECQSMIDGQQVVYMQGNISTDGSNNASITKSIYNQDLYNKNKVEVRKDMADFEALVYETEDNLIKNNTETRRVK